MSAIRKFLPRTKHVQEGFLKSSFVQSSPVCEQVLDISQIAIAFHKNTITSYHPIHIAIIWLMSLLLLDVQLFLQFRLSLIDEVYLFDDSMIILQNACQNLINCLHENLLASATLSVNFRKFFSVSCKVLVWHGLHRVARTCTTTAYRWLFRDSRPSLRILCSAVIKSPYFSARRIDLFWFFAEVSMNTMLPFFCVSTFEVSPSESEFSLSEECASTCAFRSSGSLWRAVTKQECLALDLPCSSRLLVRGSPWPAGHDLSASVSRMHACHFESALDLTMFPIFWNN